MQIESGLLEHMVLQRSTGTRTSPRVEGTSGLRGSLMLRFKGTKPARWSSPRQIGAARAGRFVGTLNDIPVGGPYTVELSIRTTKARELVTVEDVWVGDVWLVAGQSNMCGCGPSGAPVETSPRVRAFYLNDTWRIATDPIWHAFGCVDSIHPALNGGTPDNPADSAAPGAAIVFALKRAHATGVPVGLIASAQPGSGMGQWSPALKSLGGASLYGAMLRRVRKNGGRVAGLLWYQGEAEAGPAESRRYLDTMRRFFSELRADLDDDSMPILMAQLGRVVGSEFSDECWSRVRDAQRCFPGLVSGLTLIPTVDLPLGDLIHLRGDAQQELGRRMAAYAKGQHKPLALRRVTYHVSYLTADVRVEFDHVVGGFFSEGRPSGFEVRDGEGHKRSFAIELDRACIIIKTTLNAEDIKKARLYYGFGCDPYCNIRDGAGRFVPAMGPISIPGPVVSTPFVTALRVSGVMTARKQVALHRLPYRSPQSLDMGVTVFEGSFCNVHHLIHQGPSQGMIYFACDIRTETPMSLALKLGYDGPLRVWFDRKAVLTDPGGTCPARADARSLPLRVGRGRHEILIALGVANGAAWGVFLRIERTDRLGVLTEIAPEILG